MHPIGASSLHISSVISAPFVSGAADKGIRMMLLNLYLIVDKLCAELGKVYRAVIVAQKPLLCPG